jgi:hypothetical protein
MLEDAMEVWLLNARHMRNIPGRKTDVSDASWICQLIEFGLVRPSFVPPKPIRELRNLTRYRKAQIEERNRETQRLDLRTSYWVGVSLAAQASPYPVGQGSASPTAQRPGLAPSGSHRCAARETPTELLLPPEVVAGSRAAALAAGGIGFAQR